MASTFNHLSFFFLLLVLSSVQIEARVNKFFSKFIHTDHNDVPQLTPSLPLVPSPAPVSAPPEISPNLAPTPAPAAAPFFDESQNAYGLYGRQSDDTENSPTLTDVEEEILAEDAGDESYKSGYPKTNLHGSGYGSPSRYDQYQSDHENNGYRNYQYQSDHENNGYRNYQYQSDHENNGYRNYQYQSDHENNGYRNYQYQSDHENNGYRRNGYEPTERQGMSDTRFMENGKYYYNTNSRSGEEGDSYGSKKYPNEFDSMEEYEKSDEFLH